MTNLTEAQRARLEAVLAEIMRARPGLGRALACGALLASNITPPANTPEQRAARCEVCHKRPCQCGRGWIDQELAEYIDELKADSAMATVYSDQIEGLRDILDFGAHNGTAWYEAVRDLKAAHDALLERVGHLESEYRHLADLRARAEADAAAWNASADASYKDYVEWKVRAEQAEAERDAARKEVALLKGALESVGRRLMRVRHGSEPPVEEALELINDALFVLAAGREEADRGE